MIAPSTIPVAARRRHRVLGWFAGGGEAPDAGAAQAVAEQRTTVRRRLFDDIGTLLFRHDLTPSPRIYGVLHAYVSGEDPRTGAAVAAHLNAATLTDAAVAGIATANDAEQASTLSRIADALETRIGDCLAAVGASRDTAQTFGSALHVEARNLRSDPGATLTRIIALTEAAVEASRLVEAQLHRARDEADALRQDLRNARRAAEHDHLTGLPNRRSFEERLAAAAERDTPSVVALIDIDDFKQVNDRFGHEAGDRVLKFVASFLRAQLPRDVLVARYGGEEFAILFQAVSLDQASHALDEVRERLSLRSLVHQDSGQAIGHVTFSAGVAAVDGADTLRVADLALYAAKGAGKNRIERTAA